MSLEFDVQKAIYSALDTALSVDVYDDVPTAASMPYVVIDTVQAVPDETIQRKRDIVTVFLTVWTNYGGNKKVLEILETIRSTLDHARLSLDSGTMIRAYMVNRSTERDIQEHICKGRARLRVIAQH